MPDPAILPALRATIRENEIGAKSPYELEFAQKGQSGASFGFMQGDMHVQKDARDTMVAVLTAAGVAPAKITQLMTALTPALPKGNPLNAADAKLVNDALNSATGRPLVDAMDQRIFQGIAKDVDARFEAHVKGTGAKYTRWKRPLRIVARISIATKGEALRAEQAFKQETRAEKLRWCAAGLEGFVARLARP